MPVIPFERIPLPSLRTYTTVSVCLLVCGLIYAHQSVMRLAELSANPPPHQEHLHPPRSTPSHTADADVSYPKGTDIFLNNPAISHSDDNPYKEVLDAISLFGNDTNHVHDLGSQAKVKEADGIQLDLSSLDDANKPGVGEASVDDARGRMPQSFVHHVPGKHGKYHGHARYAYQEFEYQGYGYEMMAVMLGETWCIWVVVNMAYCCLILVGKLIQYIVFGQLRVSEFQHLKDKFWNFVFYKFIFVFGVLNVQTMEEVVLWCAWFSFLGFLDLLAQLCKDRFEYLSFSPSTTWWTHSKVLGLLLTIQLMCTSLLAFSAMLGYIYVSLNTFSFMAAECVLMVIKTSYVITRYGIHLWELNHEGVWENRAVYTYYAELVFELSALSVDFVHHLHMLLWSNIFLSMASLVICLQLRFLFHEFQRRIRRHKNYRRVVTSMEARFPLATKEELDDNNDDCAICWEHMDNARKLPCGHLFHNACLRSWLEQDISCPTCRMSLSDGPRPQPAPPFVPHPGAAGDGPPPQAAPPQPANHQTTNHFFHFDGSRYVSWLPSFSVEVTHTQLLGNVINARQAQAHSSQLDNMARQVQDVFPHLPLPLLVDDLRQTRSVELTIDNIIEGRLTVPPNYVNRNATPEGGPEEVPPDAADQPSSSSSSSVQSDDSSTSSSEPVTEEETGSFLQPTAALANFSDDDHLIDVSTPPESEETEGASAVLGSRFSKASGEREEMLVNRKSQLLEQARRRFMLKQPGEDSEPPISTAAPEASPSSASSFMDIDFTHSERSQFTPDEQSALRRRQLAYEAAARRMQQH